MTTIAGIQFLAISDPKRQPLPRVEAAMAAYEARFQRPCNIVVLNPSEAVEVAGVEVVLKATIARGNVWAGRREG